MFLASPSPVDKGARTPEQPRSVLQLETPANEPWSPSDLNNKSTSMNGSGISVRNGSSGSAYLAWVQERDGVHGAEQKYEVSEEREHVQTSFSAPETITYSLESGADSGTIHLGVQQTDHSVTRRVIATTTETEAVERKSTDVQKAEHSVIVREGVVQPWKYVSTFSSQTSTGEQQNETQSVTNGLSSASHAIEIRRMMVPSKSTHGSVREQFIQLERLHREERDRMISLVTDEHEEYKLFYEAQIEAFQSENERLLREISTSTSRITLLEDQLNSMTVTVLQDDKVHAVITTTITSITTIITTVTARIEHWKQIVSGNNGQVSISRKELEQLSLELCNTSSQMTALQEHHAELSRDFNSIRHELQVTLSLRDAKDRTIASLTTEVVTWKNADAAKAQEIAAVRREKDGLRRDLSVASSRAAELQQRYEVQSSELVSARSALQNKVSLIEERDRTIISFTTEVAQWKRSDVAKAEQIAIARRDYEKVQRDLSASSSQTAGLQQRYDAQSKEIASLRKELEASKTLVKEKERTISTLTAKVEQREVAETTTAEQFAAERRDKEKLQQDLASFSSQVAVLQQRYDAQSQDIVSLRGELQSKVSLLEEKEHRITSLTTEVAQVTREDNVKTEQVASARRDSEQLRRELATASSRIEVIQTRYETQSKELHTVRDELHQIEILYAEGTHRASIEPSKHAVSQRIAQALEKKTKQVEELRRDLAVSTTRNTELQRSYEVLSREVSAARDELKVKTSQYELTVTSLTAQVDQWKRSDAEKAEQIATTLREVKKLQIVLSASTSHLVELQSRFETQSREFAVVRKELETKASYYEGKDRTIASLTTEVDQWKAADGKKAEEIATALKRVEKLERDLMVSASGLVALQGRYEVQSRELTVVRNELQTNSLLQEGKDHNIASLTAEVEQWKRANATKAEQIAATIARVEKLERELSASSSLFAELQGRYGTQSDELVSMRNELQSKTTSYEEKARTVVALTVQVEEWKRTDALKEERIVTISKRVEDLQRDLTSSSSQLIELQRSYDVQSKEVRSLRDQVSGKDRAVSSLTSQVEEWKRSDATKVKELQTARKDVEQFRRDMASSSSQIVELQQRYDSETSEFSSRMEEWKRSDATKTKELTIARKVVEQLHRDLATSSSQIESWQRSDATKTEELTHVRKDLEQLRRDLSSSSSQIIEHQRRYEARSAELTCEIEQWKRSDATKVEELSAARTKIEELQRNLSASSCRIVELQQRYEAQSTESTSLREQIRVSSVWKDRTVVTLNGQIEQWKLADAAKAEELGRARRDVEQLQRQLSASSSQIEELHKHYAEQLDTLNTSSIVSEESRKTYEKITTEVKDYAAVIKLTTTVDEWLRADARRAEDLAAELAKRNKENEELRHHLVTLKEIYVRAPALKQIFQSESVEIQRRHEEQSTEVKLTLAGHQSQLNGVQHFVTTVDTPTDTMVVQMLQKLNAGVQQSTIFMAECIVEDFRPRGANLTQEQSSAVNRVSTSIGQPLAGCLGRKERDDLALYLQIAFQAYITYYLRSLISSWTSKKGYNDLINKTYEQMQQSEAQAISGRWRSLTRTYLSPACMNDANVLISATVEGLSDIVVAAGCAASPSAAKSKVSSQFGDKVSSIMSIAGQFGKMIGQVVSADFDVLAVRPLEMFEETTMEQGVDDYDKGQAKAGGTATGQKVLCSTQLGMTKRVQLDSGKRDTSTVIKAKVVLQSFLDH